MIEKNNNWQLGQQGTVTGLLRNAVESRPHHKFIEFESGEKATYEEFYLRSRLMAVALSRCGVVAGDTVGAMLDTNLDCVTSWFATNLIGAIWVPFNTALKGEFLRHQICNSGARVLLAESDYAERIKSISEKVSDLQKLFVRDHEGKVQDDGLNFQVAPLADLYPKDAVHEELKHTCKPSDLSMLIYTSGTTGPSKGCMISHNYCANMARLSRDSANRSSEDVNWSCLPMFHLNATTITVLATVATMGSCYFTPRFSVSNFWKSIDKSGATVVSILGQMVPLIAQVEDSPEIQKCFGQVRGVMAAPFDEDLQEVWKSRFGVKIAGANSYGLTEASMITSLPAGEYAKPGSSGRRNEYFDVMIVDDEMNELPPGCSGEVVCRPTRPHIMFEGYWNDPQKTVEVLHNLWLHTGDIGKFDEEGFFYFVDRKKDYLRRGGENISSYEVETALHQHPGIKEVAVHAVFSDLSEDEVKATVVLKDGVELTPENLCRWSIDQLPYYAIPRYIEFRDSLPTNPLGKVMKYQLRDEGVTSTTWDRSNSTITFEKR